jgi:hypothetical protein
MKDLLFGADVALGGLEFEEEASVRFHANRNLNAISLDIVEPGLARHGQKKVRATPPLAFRFHY